MLRAACDVAPKSVFVCGSSASAAGLTVAIQRDAGRASDVSIEAGALVRGLVRGISYLNIICRFSLTMGSVPLMSLTR
jgi:hypothetical protein